MVFGTGSNFVLWGEALTFCRDLSFNQIKIRLSELNCSNCTVLEIDGQAHGNILRFCRRRGCRPLQNQPTFRVTFSHLLQHICVRTLQEVHDYPYGNTNQRAGRN